MTAETKLREAALAMQKRLLVWKRLHIYHSEVGDKEIPMPVPDLWNQQDQAALDLFEEALNEVNGARPLFDLKETA